MSQFDNFKLLKSYFYSPLGYFGFWIDEKLR